VQRLNGRWRAVRVANFGLLCLALVPLIMLGSRVIQGPEYRTLGAGDLIPPGTDLPSGECVQAFICTTACPYCATLAGRVSTIDGPDGEQPYWLMVGSDADVADFAARHALPRGQVVSFRPKLPRATLVEQRWDLVGTPHRLIVTKSGQIADARLSHEILTREALQTFCDE
jgi:hypothetical protein